MPDPQPLYTAHNLHPAYSLRYGWSGWPASGTLPDPLPDGMIDTLTAQWKIDGLHLLEFDWSSESVQFTVSTTPEITPVFLASRIKGRLQHALRKSGHPTSFSRKLAVRSIGDNRRQAVEGYIRKQARKEGFADPRYVETLHRNSISDPRVDLSMPTETRSGRYWYNLHIVLVATGSHAIADEDSLKRVRELSQRIALKKGYRISELFAMPNHLHVALRGNGEESPQEIALGFQNNLAYALGRYRVWEDTYYAGTFGEYSTAAVRERGS